MRYELQVHAISPLCPPLGELLARAADSGIEVEPRGPGAAPGAAWTRLDLAAVGSAERSFSVERVPDRAEALEALRLARDEGEDVPDQALEAQALYVLTTDYAEARPDETGLAAFMVTAWALAGLTDGLVYDPQEEFFADAESFWALLADEDAAAEALAAVGPDIGGEGRGGDGGPQDDGRPA